MWQARESKDVDLRTDGSESGLLDPTETTARLLSLTLASDSSVVMPVRVRASSFLQKGAKGSKGSKNQPMLLDEGHACWTGPPSNVPGEKRMDVPEDAKKQS